MDTALVIVAALSSMAAVVMLAVLLVSSRSRRDPELENLLRDELRQARREASESAASLRTELAGMLAASASSASSAIGELGKAQADRIESLRASTDTLVANARRDAENSRLVIEQKLKAIEEANGRQLDEIRKVVEVKLGASLETGFARSFGSVRESLEAVQKGLTEMQVLAAGVGDLKKVLANVKTRGTWGETQIGALLEEALAPEQYARNVKVRRDSNEMVEYAVKLPGRGDGTDSCVWLPIDSKFPVEDYQRLMEALEEGDQVAAEAHSANLAKKIEASAREIREKYVNPPETTDFAVMFLPTEGLYAEVLRRPGTVERLQNSYRILVAGPVTLLAMLTSLRLGFRTLAIEKRSSEVWKVLAGVRREFEKFEEALEKAARHLETAKNSLDSTSRRSRVLGRQLRSVESLPGSVEESGQDPLQASLDDDLISEEGAGPEGEATPAP